MVSREDRAGAGSFSGRLFGAGLVPKIVAIMIVVAVATGGLIGITLTGTSRHELRRSLLDGNLAHADLAAEFATNYVKVIQANIRSFASRPTIRQAILADRPEDRRGELVAFLQTQPALDSISLYDARGISRASGFPGARNIGRVHTDREWFQQVMVTRKPYLGLALKSRVSGRPIVPYAVPLLNDKGEVAGVLVGGIFLKALSDAIVGFTIAPDARASLNDLRGGGIILAHKNPQRILTPISGRNEAVRLAMEGHRGTMETQSSDGTLNLVAYTPVPQLPWAVLVFQPSKTALAPVRAQSRQAWLIIVLATFITTLGGILLARRMTRPLMALRDAALEIASGNLSRRVQVTQGDEIGTLAQTFNTMAASLLEREAAMAAVEKARAATEMIDGMLDPVVITDPDGRILQANQAFQDTYGYGQDLLGEPLSRLVVEEDIPGITNAIAQARESGRLRNFPCTCLTRGGQIFPVLVNLRLFNQEGGAPKGLVATVRDITEIRKVEADLKQARIFTDAVLHSVPGILYVYDEQGTLVQWNQTFEEVSGFRADELRHKKIPDWFDEGEKEAVAEAARQVFEKGRAAIEAHLVVKDGRRLPYYFTGVPVSISGRPYLVGVGIDMTERIRAEEAKRKAEENLRRANAALARSNVDLEQFAYVASHDLQEPLRMIASYLQLIEKRYGERIDGDGREFMKYAVDGAARMQHLIGDLLAYSRVAIQGRAFKPTDMKEAFEQAVRNLEVLIGETGAVVACEGSLPVVMADASQMMQVFQNLLANAIRFRGARPPEIRVCAIMTREGWRFSVRDNGMGMDIKYADRIFKLFQRLERREDYDGTGTGLAIVKKIVERHGGRVWVDSTPGEGSIFYFNLPATGGKTDEKKTIGPAH